MCGAPASRAAWHVTAAMLPPALQPHTASWPGSAAELGGVVGDPAHGGEGVVGGGGKRALGGVAVVDGDDDRTRAHAQVAAQRIVGHRAAEDPAAAVEVDDHGMGSGGRRPVQPVGEVTGRAGKGAVDDLAHLRAGWALLVGGHRQGSGVGHRQLLERRHAELGVGLQHQLHVGLEAPDHAVVHLGAPVRTGPAEAEVVLGDHVVAHLPVAADPADVGQEHAGLARHVCPHVPGVGVGVQGDVGAVVDVLDPGRLGGLGGFDHVEAVGAQGVDAVGDPVHVLLDRHHHVRQHRRAPRPGDHEQVGEPLAHQPEVGLGTVGPLVLDRPAPAAGDVDVHDGAGHGVEAGGEHDGVELERLAGPASGHVLGLDAGLGDGADRRGPQVDEPDVGEVVGLVVVGVEAGPLGAHRVVGGAQQSRRWRGRRRWRGSSPARSRPAGRWRPG